MESACQSYHREYRNECYTWSTNFYIAVSQFGGPNYEDAQVRHCHCCELE